MNESQPPVGYPEPTHSEQILRHVVGIQVQIQIAKSRRPANGRMADAEIASAIIVSISEQWFLVTAGHLVEELRARHQLGDRILGCRLLTLANSEGDMPTIPFGLIDPESPTFLNADLIPFAVNQEGLDCLVVPIGDDLRELLDLRGIRALHESTWRSLSFVPTCTISLVFLRHWLGSTKKAIGGRSKLDCNFRHRSSAFIRYQTHQKNSSSRSSGSSFISRK